LQFQKIIHTPNRRDWGWGVSARSKNLKKCTKVNWNFQRGAGGVFSGEPGMDIFWNLTT